MYFCRMLISKNIIIKGNHNQIQRSGITSIRRDADIGPHLTKLPPSYVPSHPRCLLKWSAHCHCCKQKKCKRGTRVVPPPSSLWPNLRLHRVLFMRQLLLHVIENQSLRSKNFLNTVANENFTFRALFVPVVWR